MKGGVKVSYLSLKFLSVPQVPIPAVKTLSLYRKSGWATCTVARQMAFPKCHSNVPTKHTYKEPCQSMVFPNILNSSSKACIQEFHTYTKHVFLPLSFQQCQPRSSWCMLLTTTLSFCVKAYIQPHKVRSEI
jgi:hypothetical protein